MNGMDEARRLIALEREQQTGFLDLGNLGLTEWPEELFELSHLRRLNLALFYQDDLGYFNFANSHLGELQNQNQLAEFPETLYQLENLVALDIGDTKIRDLSPAQGLTRLQNLDCSNTRINDLSPLRGLTDLQSLDCWGTQVNDLSPIRGLTHLQSLNCAFTNIHDLSPLRGLTGLHFLNCEGTQITDLSPLQSLTGLQSLNCSETQISDLSSLQGLTGLQSLHCANTLITELSPLQGLKGLQLLVCWGTQITDLTPLQYLAGLRTLDCSRTPIKDLSPLLTLSLLKSIKASHCALMEFPLALVGRESLRELVLHETLLPGIPLEVLSESTFDNCLAPLRAHFTDLEAGAEPVQEAKLVVLGNGRVGKTQVCRRLRGLDFDESVSSTHGITVTAEPWAGAPEEETLNIWDFGGQDIYHGAHTLFMKTSAVFLLVWRPDFEGSAEVNVDGLTFRNYPLPYWLEYIRTLGCRDSPVLVVQTGCERPEQEVRRLPVDDALLDFPSLKPCWYSAKNQRGRGALEDALRDAIAYLRERDGVASIGAGRMRVLRQLEAWREADMARPTPDRERRTLSREAFRNLCEQVGGVTSADHLLSYLHNLGVVFHQPGLFHDRIILDQSWALDAVYAVFDRTKAYPLILGQYGRFTPSLLSMTVWRDYAEEERALFLSLMQSCGIAFVHREADRRAGSEIEYLAPDALPGKEQVVAQLAGRWEEAGESRTLEYDYPFLHPGLMRALICDVGEHSHDNGVYWKYGLWVYEPASGCRALLEQIMQDDRRGRITLRLQGPRPERLGRWLRERIEARNRLFGYPALTPTRDELEPLERFEMEARHGRRPAAFAPDRVPAPAPAEPAFGKPPASFYPDREPQVFVSYAWGDDSPEGRSRGKLVDDLCEAMAGQGLTIRRDRDELRPGDLISDFMDRLAAGDCILAVISDKYLRSEYCMYELFRIWRNCADQPERFQGKVIPLILPDAKLNALADRLHRAIYWEEQEEALRPLISGHMTAVGNAVFGKFRLIGEFARNTSDMLEHLVDKLQPRDFERQAAEGFQEVLEQLRRLR